MCICRINFIIPYLNTSFLSLHTLISLLESKLVLMDGNNRKIDIPSGLFLQVIPCYSLDEENVKVDILRFVGVHQMYFQLEAGARDTNRMRMK